MLGSPASVDLLLRLLEARTLLATRRSILLYDPAAGSDLLDSGLLVQAGFDTAIIAADEENAPAYDVVFDHERQGLGYRSPLKGWVAVDQAELERFRVDIGATASMLLGEDLRAPTRGPREIVPDLVWDIGALRLLRSALTPVWLARRLSAPSAAQVMAEALQRQPDGRRIVLTSTRFDRLQPGLLRLGSRIISVHDVPDPYRSPRLSIAALRALCEGRPAEAATEAVHLSSDGRVLTILNCSITFGGSNQRKAIAIVIDAYRAGRGVNAADTLGEAGFGTSIRTFAQAFKKQWPVLGRFLRPRNKLWRLEM